MSIKQRNGTWWLDISTPSGERIRRSTGTTDKKSAQEYHDRLKAQLWRQHRLGEVPAKSFEEAALRFLREHQAQDDFEAKATHIAYWRTVFGGKTLDAVTTDSVLEGLPTHKTYKRAGPQPLAPATRNRYLATLRTMMNLCETWKWVSRAPKLPDEDEPAVRVRWITKGEASALLAAIGQQWLRDVAAMALATGMRAGEVLGLTWDQVDLVRGHAWLTAGQTKSSRARAVPLNADAVAVIRRRVGTHLRYVFTRNGKPLEKIDRRMFLAACDAAGIQDFRFHDLRHTWASWHVQAGTPLMVLKELGGWETVSMVQKYAHLGTSHLAAHAANVTFTAHASKLPTLEAEKPPLQVALTG